MNIDDTPREVAYEVTTEDSHEACQHQQSRLILLDSSQQGLIECFARVIVGVVDNPRRYARSCSTFQSVGCRSIGEYGADCKIRFATGVN